MKTKLIIVRHTHTVGNLEKRLTGRCDYDITKEGENLIKKLTKKLSNVKFDKVYASTSGRAIKTVQPLANLNNLQVIQDENLCEMYFGIYDGWKWEDVNKIDPTIKQTQNEINEIAGIPEQETMKDAEVRMTNIIKKIAKENVGKTVLIGSHGVSIEAFLRGITKEPFCVRREEYSQKNTSINEVEYDLENDSFEIIKLNEINHLYEEQEYEH